MNGEIDPPASGRKTAYFRIVQVENIFNADQPGKVIVEGGPSYKIHQGIGSDRDGRQRIIGLNEHIVFLRDVFYYGFYKKIIVWRIREGEICSNGPARKPGGVNILYAYKLTVCIQLYVIPFRFHRIHRFKRKKMPSPQVREIAGQQEFCPYVAVGFHFDAFGGQFAQIHVGVPHVIQVGKGSNRCGPVPKIDVLDDVIHDRLVVSDAYSRVFI